MRRSIGCVIASALIAASCAGSNANESGSASTTSPATIVAPASTNDETGVDAVEVVSVGVTDAVMATVAITEFDEIPSDIDALTSGRLDAGVELTAAEPLGGVVRLTMPVGLPPTPDAVAGVLHQFDDGTFQLTPALYDADTGTATVWVDSFSNFFSGWWNPFNWVEEAIRAVGGAIDFAADWATGRTDPPPCANDPPAWATVDTSSATSIHVCAQSNPSDDGTERVEVFIKSNRSTMQAITIPTGVDYVWMEYQPDWFRPLSAWVAGDTQLQYQLGTAVGAPTGINLSGIDHVTSPQILTLFGGESMSFGFTRPAADITNDVRVWVSEAQAVTNHALGLLGGLPAPEALGVVAVVYGCAAGIVGDQPPVLSSAEGSALVDELVKCGLNLLSEPALLADVAAEVGTAVGIDPSRLVEAVPSSLVSAAKGLARAISGAGVVINLIDAFVDSATDSVVTITMAAEPAAGVSEAGGEPPPSTTEFADDASRQADAECGLNRRYERDFSPVGVVHVACDPLRPVALVGYADAAGNRNVVMYNYVDIEMLPNWEWLHLEQGVGVSGYTPEAVADITSLSIADAYGLYLDLGFFNADTDVRAVEALREVSVPSLCGHPAAVAVDGTVPTNDPLGSAGFWEMDLDAAVAGALDDDGSDEYAVTVNCSAGGVAWPSYLLMFDNDLTLLGYFNVADLFPAEDVWRGGIFDVSFDPHLSGGAGFEVSGTGPTFSSYFVLESIGDYPCVTVGDIDTLDPYPVDVTGGGGCGSVSAPPANVVPPEQPVDPVEVFTRYLLAAGARDYGGAWSMLTSGYQAKYGGYGSFTRFWDTIDVVGINSTSVVSNGTTSTITADLWFQRFDGSTSSEIVEVDVTEGMISDYRFLRAY